MNDLHFDRSKFLEKVTTYWTKDRLDKLTAKHHYPITPLSAPLLLRVIGLLNRDGTLSADHRRKYIQVNHLLLQFEPFLTELSERHPAVRLLDLGCGSSFLSFMLGYCFRFLWKKPFFMVGVDSNAKLITKNRAIASFLGLDDALHFATDSIATFDWHKHSSQRPHAVMALHACDTATCDALALGVHLKADFIAVAPCCQAELAKRWKSEGIKLTDHPLKPAFASPHIRRELAATMTDLARMLLLRGCGYEVTATEFTMAHNTPKNTLLTGVRRGSYHKEAQEEALRLRSSWGGMNLKFYEHLLL